MVQNKTTYCKIYKNQARIINNTTKEFWHFCIKGKSCNQLHKSRNTVQR